MVTISIIIPVYNAESTLRQCVDSIISQDFEDYELLLIDDGSTDGSPALCDEYMKRDSHVSVIHKKNGGVSSARNVGLQQAKGEWITFIDSDDYVSASYLNAIEGRDEDLIIVPYVWFNSTIERKDERLANYTQLNGHDDISSFLNKFLTTMIFRAPSALFFKQNLISGILYNEDMKVGEDACFVHEYLLRVNSMSCYHSSSYNFRLSETGASVKYGCSTNYSIVSLSSLFKSFEAVKDKWHLDKRLFLSYLKYFKMICRDDWMKRPSLWYRNDTVHSFYSYVWQDLPLKHKLKYRFIRFLSIFR